MKLNQDCLRDFLLYCEDNLSYTNEILVNSLKLKEYSIEELVYTAQKLNEADFLTIVTKPYVGTAVPSIRVKSITYEGHKFLDNIRDDSIWKKAKSILNPIKSMSVEIISETAAKIITQLINQKL